MESPDAGAGMALYTGREVGVVAGSALVTQNTGHTFATVTLSGFRVTGRTQGALQITVAS